MKATVTWKDRMAFVGMPDSGFPVQMDSGFSAGGDNSGVSPMELIALGLAGCTAMDVISILQKKRQTVTHFDVQVDATRSKDHPKVFINAVINYVVTGSNISEDAVLRAIELSVTKYCPVQSMLSQAFPMDLRYEIYENEGEGKRRLMYQGVWQDLPQE